MHVMVGDRCPVLRQSHNTPVFRAVVVSLDRHKRLSLDPVSIQTKGGNAPPGRKVIQAALATDGPQTDGDAERDLFFTRVSDDSVTKVTFAENYTYPGIWNYQRYWSCGHAWVPKKR